jgi:hypothetical protein
MATPLQCLHWITHSKYYTKSLLFTAALLQLTHFFTVYRTELNSPGLPVTKSFNRTLSLRRLTSNSSTMNFPWLSPTDTELWSNSLHSTVILYLLGMGHAQKTQHCTQSQSYVTTDDQLASLSWNKAPTWGLRPDLDYCLTVAGLLVWGALFDGRTGLSFAIATGPRQCSHFWVRVL